MFLGHEIHGLDVAPVVLRSIARLFERDDLVDRGRLTFMIELYAHKR
jgi:hypothetical protein